MCAHRSPMSTNDVVKGEGKGPVPSQDSVVPLPLLVLIPSIFILFLFCLHQLFRWFPNLSKWIQTEEKERALCPLFSSCPPKWRLPVGSITTAIAIFARRVSTLPTTVSLGGLWICLKFAICSTAVSTSFSKRRC